PVVDPPPTVADLLERLGGVPPSRVRMSPAPGTAVEDDLFRADGRNRLCELVDGTLVEKPMGYHESALAIWIGHLLFCYLEENDVGELAGADGALRLMPGLVRIPDVAFVRREKLSIGGMPLPRLPTLAPDLAIEVLSASNTAGEMKRKIAEYFAAGSSLVWLVDPKTRSVDVYTAPDAVQTVGEDGSLDGAGVLPGLILSVRKIFERTPTAASAASDEPTKVD
ncbi:MAG: Uma2 family endonuclease, partial [Planctomycetia bacterium]